MKKILLLIVSGLLIACMAGSVMALGESASSTLVKAENNAQLTAADLDLVNGVPLNLQISISGYTSIDVSNQYLLSASGKAMSTGDAIGDDADISVVVIGDPYFYLPSSLTDPFVYEDATIIVTLNGAPEGAVYKVTARVDDVVDEILFTSTSTNATSVPEFPTVALPVAAILGLVFIFGRKKEGL